MCACNSTLGDPTSGAGERTGGRYEGLIETFFESQRKRGFDRDYFDDMNWMGLALLRAYDLKGKTAYLDEARALFDALLAEAPDTGCCGPTLGGSGGTARTPRRPRR